MENKEAISTGTIVGIIVAAVLLVIAIVLCIKFREKIAKSLRVYKSELKKVVWLPWDQTRKSALVVLLVMVVCAIAICTLDRALNFGFGKFVEAIAKSAKA